MHMYDEKERNLPNWYKWKQCITTFWLTRLHSYSKNDEANSKINESYARGDDKCEEKNKVCVFSLLFLNRNDRNIFFDPRIHLYQIEVVLFFLANIRLCSGTSVLNINQIAFFLIDGVPKNDSENRPYH